MRTSLLDYYKTATEPPGSAVAEAHARGLALTSPLAARWDVVQDFVDAYCRDLTPAGVLVVAPDPSVGGAVASGIPLTDAIRAREMLSLDCGGTLASPASAEFWRVVDGVRRATGEPPLESLFASVHLAHAIPFGLATRHGEPVSVPHRVHELPALQRASRALLERLLATTRPQVVLCVGRLAFESVAACADNAHALGGELALGWERVVLSRAYSLGLAAYPRADFGSFRARLVPVDALDGPWADHAQETLAGLLRDAWT